MSPLTSPRTSSWLNPIWLILTVAVINRFWDFWSLPYTYDEYSTLNRISVPGWQNFVEQGILTDAHPGGLYSIMRLYTSWFGTTSWVVKLPFLIMGVACVYLVYRIAKSWFGEQVAWLTAALLACLQFPVMYSQISRMYTPGLMFCLLAVLIWTREYLGAEKRNTKNILLLGFAFGLAVYTHYFAGLLCIGLWLLGWFFVKPSRRKDYLFPALIGALVFLPHLSTTWHQLGKKGIGQVLGVPDANFLVGHWQYIFHFSGILSLLALAGALFSMLKSSTQERKKWLFAVALFLFPIAIGWLYSNFRAPILQDRVLLFSLPFGLMAISVFAAKLKEKLALTLVFAVLVGLSAHLQLGRFHRSLFAADGFSFVMDRAFERPQDVTLVISAKSEFVPFMAAASGHADEEFPTRTFFTENTWSIREYLDFFDQQTGDLEYAWTTDSVVPPYELSAVLDERYGGRKDYVPFYHGEWFSYGEGGVPASKVISSYPPTAGDQPGWKIGENVLSNDSILGKVIRFESEDLFGVSFEGPLDSLASHQRDRLFFSVTGKFDRNTDAMLVTEVLKDDSTIFRRDIPIREFIRNNYGFGRAHICLPLYDIALPPGELIFKCYVWNMENDTFVIQAADVWSDGGNPIIYGLDKPLNGQW
jgi:hypothetical protein